MGKPPRDTDAFYRLRVGDGVKPPVMPEKGRFTRFFRKTKGLKGPAERGLASIRAGKPVTRLIAGAFCDYQREVLGVEADIDLLFDRVRPPIAFSVWESTQTLFGSMTNVFTPSEEMFVKNGVEDYVLAARMIMISVGHKHAGLEDETDDHSCLMRAEKLMSRTPEEYASWMRKVSRGYRMGCVVSFSTVRNVRIGASVILPLTAEASRLVTTGLASDMDIRPGDLEATSGHIFVSAMSNGEGHPRVKPRDKTKAQSRTVLYQIAYYAWRLRPFSPTVITFAAGELIGEILRRQGFLETDATLKGTNFPIMVFRRRDKADHRRPRARSRAAHARWLAAYRAFLIMLRLFQGVNSHKWKQDERIEKAAEDPR